MSRKSISNNTKILLYSEVNGYCPMCNIRLMYSKGKRLEKHFEVAHIYPLNPTAEEKRILNDVEKLSENVDSIENLIAVCPNCHSRFDKPRTLQEYNVWVDIKKSLVAKKAYEDLTKQMLIEKDIIEIINKLSRISRSDELIELKYSALAIDEKLNDDFPTIQRNQIRDDIVKYFLFVKENFRNLQKEETFDIIATQIKLAYLNFKKMDNEQTKIYNSLIYWLKDFSKAEHNKSCEIIIAYFIQNCEVFERNDISK